MTVDKDRKRIIRRRMQRTGESYTTARVHVLSRTTRRPAPPVDTALAGMSDDRIVAKTGRGWRDWVRLLDADGAAAMPHREIAVLVRSKHGVSDWWAQTVTVGYERIKGLREVGQRRSGEYEAGKTKTFSVPVEVLFDAWADDAMRRRWLDGVEVKVRTATRPKSLRLQLSDGTAVLVMCNPKGPARSVASVTHIRLADRASLHEAKQYWSERFDALAGLLAAGR